MDDLGGNTIIFGNTHFLSTEEGYYLINITTSKRRIWHKSVFPFKWWHLFLEGTANNFSTQTYFPPLFPLPQNTCLSLYQKQLASDAYNH